VHDPADLREIEAGQLLAQRFGQMVADRVGVTEAFALDDLNCERITAGFGQWREIDLHDVTSMRITWP